MPFLIQFGFVFIPFKCEFHLPNSLINFFDNYYIFNLPRIASLQGVSQPLCCRRQAPRWFLSDTSRPTAAATGCYGYTKLYRGPALHLHQAGTISRQAGKKPSGPHLAQSRAQGPRIPSNLKTLTYFRMPLKEPHPILFSIRERLPALSSSSSHSRYVVHRRQVPGEHSSGAPDLWATQRRHGLGEYQARRK